MAPVVFVYWYYTQYLTVGCYTAGIGPLSRCSFARTQFGHGSVATAQPQDGSKPVAPATPASPCNQPPTEAEANPIDKGKAPRVGLIIVNHNSGCLLDRSLAALENQIRKPDRIIVVDNASNDGSANRIRTRWKNIQLISLQRNVGFAAANNHALRLCEDCAWVALLNPDAFPEPRWLDALVSAAAEDPHAGSFASCLVTDYDSGILDGAGDSYHVSGLVWRTGHGRPRDQGGYQKHEVFSACAAAALYQRQAIVRVGGFDESYFCYNEDVDLGFRLRLIGLRCWFVPDAVAVHVGSAVSGKHSDFSLFHGHRNLVWTYLKNMPRVLIRRYWWQHLLLNLLSMVVLSLRYRSTAVLRGKLSAVLGIRKVLQQRGIVQTSKVCTDAELEAAMTTGWWRAYWGRPDVASKET